jgi:hypothetical protein
VANGFHAGKPRNASRVLPPQREFLPFPPPIQTRSMVATGDQDGVPAGTNQDAVIITASTVSYKPHRHPAAAFLDQSGDLDAHRYSVRDQDP